jgi:hypothetical protein
MIVIEPHIGHTNPAGQGMQVPANPDVTEPGELGVGLLCIDVMYEPHMQFCLLAL